MNNKIKLVWGVSILSLCLTVGAGVAFAVDSPAVTSQKMGQFECTKEKTGKEVCLRRAEKKLSTETNQETKAEFHHRLLGNINNIADNQYDRGNIALTRMDNALARIKIQVGKLDLEASKQAGIDKLIQKSDRQSLEAATSLKAVQEKYQILQGLVTVDREKPPKQEIRDFQSQIKESKKDLQDLHRTLVQIVKELKSAKESK